MQVVFVVGSGMGRNRGEARPVAARVLAPRDRHLLPAASRRRHALNRRMPLEGGLYQWAKAAFGEFGGFLVAWNLWLFAILVISSFYVMVGAEHRLPHWRVATGLVRDAAWYMPRLSVVLATLFILVAIRGLGVGKWFTGFGGVAQILTYVALIAIPIVALSRGTMHGISSIHDRAAGGVAIQPEHLRQDGVRRHVGVRVRRAHGW